MGALVALIVAAPTPLSICVYGGALNAGDADALHDAVMIEARKLGRAATIDVAAAEQDCDLSGAEVVIAFDERAVLHVGPRATAVELTGVAAADRPYEIARALFAAVTTDEHDVPIVDEALTPLPRPVEPRVVVRRPRRAPVDEPSRVFAGVGIVSRGDSWLADVELGGWLPVVESLAIGMRFVYVPEHQVEGELSITRLEAATDVTLEARVPLDARVGLALQVGGGLVWRQTGFGDDHMSEVVGVGLGGVELRWDLTSSPIYLALAVQGMIFSGGKDYEVLTEGTTIVSAPAAPRGAFGVVLRTGARW